jgi:hypothetical protein
MPACNSNENAVIFESIEEDMKVNNTFFWFYYYFFGTPSGL